MHLLGFQLRVVLETSSESYPVNNEDALAGDGSYQESCNRLYTILHAFEGCVLRVLTALCFIVPSLPLCGR